MVHKLCKREFSSFLASRTSNHDQQKLLFLLLFWTPGRTWTSILLIEKIEQQTLKSPGKSRDFSFGLTPTYAKATGGKPSPSSLERENEERKAPLSSGEGE